MLRDHVLASINLARFEAIRERYIGNAKYPDHDATKYLDLPRWIDVNIQRVGRLGLDDGEKKRVLDIGCGAGYFLFICKLLGHEVMGIDLPGVPMYRDLTALLDVPVISHRIVPFEPLPLLGQPYDVVTAHMVTFNGHCTEHVWGPGEWLYLLADLNTPTVYLELNAEHDGTLFTPGLERFFDKRGAKIEGHRVLIDRR